MLAVVAGGGLRDPFVARAFGACAAQKIIKNFGKVPLRLESAMLLGTF